MTRMAQWVIFSSFGFFIILATIILYLKRNLNQQFWFVLVLSLIMLCISKSLTYNSFWESQEKYCLYWKRIVPAMVHPKAWLGDAYFSQGKYEEAYAVFYQIIQIERFRSFAVFYAHLGRCSYFLNRYELSLEYFRKALSLNLDYADIQYYIGLDELALGRRELAKIAFQEAVRMDPTLIDARRQLLAL